MSSLSNPRRRKSHHPLPSRSTMAPLTVVKFGGGLITEKGNLKQAKFEVIDELCDSIQVLVREGHKVVLIHGAGSFGHLRAKKWKLHLGHQEELELDGEDSQISQNDACLMVRADMDELNGIIIEKLESRGLETSRHPPRTWVNGDGIDFEGDVTMFDTDISDVVVTFGDVVECKPPQDFGILSGDHLVYRIAYELGAANVVFAMGGAPGVMTGDPNYLDSKLIHEWVAGSELHGEQDEKIDVTGGIQLKVKVAEMLSKTIDNVWIVDGRHPNRIIEACLLGDTMGTKFLP